MVTVGKGHDMGMSLYGANALAEKQITAATILSYYYPGTKVVTPDCRRQNRRPLGMKIILICDFSRGGLNTRLYTLVSKPCSEATNKDYFIPRGLCFGC